jgi:hypothetical protein
MGAFDKISTEKVETASPKKAIPEKNVQKDSTGKPLKEKSIVSDEVIGNWIFKGNESFKEKKVCMVLGEDGTGKSGLVMDYITRQLKENPTHKALVIDLDNGCSSLLKFHANINKDSEGEDLPKNEERLIIKIPIEDTVSEDSLTTIDYLESVNKIKATINWLSKNAEKENFHYFVFDGLSSLLKYCERQMRLDLSLDIDGGVQTRFWMRRNKDFEEMMELVKKLPCHSFFIGHSDFILQTDSASIKIKTNALMWQRIICTEGQDEKGIFRKAKITKSKGNPQKEGTEQKFMVVTPDKVVFNSTKVFAGL